MLSQRWFIGLDLGTSGLKAVAVAVGEDGAARVAAEAAVRYPTSRPEPGASVQQPADWCQAAATATRQLLAAAAVADVSVAAVGLSGMLPTLVTLDRHGAPTGPALTWEDSRAEADGEQLVAALGRERLYAATGQRLDGRYLLPMSLRLARVDPDRTAKTTTLLGAKDYLFEWLTGVRATDPSTATGYGCYELSSGRWLEDVLEAARPLQAARAVRPLSLPDVLPAEQSFGLRAPAAELLGLPPGTPVTVGAADSVLGALGLGVGAPGEVAYLAGTSTIILGVSASLALDPELRYLVTPLAGVAGWGLEMDLLATGSSMSWLAALTGSSVADLADAAAGVDPLSAPAFLPFLAPGEQGALWDPTLAGTLVGLTLRHGRADLARALQTGIVLESQRCLQVLASVTGQAGPVWAGGGGVQSEPGGPATLAAELAAASGRPVRVGGGGAPDFSAVGAAYLAGAPRLPRPPEAAPAAQPGPPDVWAELARRHYAALSAVRPLYRHRDRREDLNDAG